MNNRNTQNNTGTSKRAKKFKTMMSAAIAAVLLSVWHMPAFAADVSGGNSAKEEISRPVPVIPQPLVQVSSKGAEGKLNPGQEFLTEITFKNKGVVAVERPVVTLTPSANISAVDNTNSSYEVKDIKPGESQSITLRWKMSDNPAAGSNEIGVGVKFYYNNGSGLSQGTDEGKILLSSNAAAQTIDGITPNVIIQSFDYGTGPVAAGEDFQLEMSVQNTDRTHKIENLMVTAEAGEGLNISGSSNVFYVKSLGGGKEQSFTLPLKVAPAARNSVANVTFQFKYEYVDGEKRSQVSSSQMVAVPIYQKDRFTILETVIPESIYAGEEQSISIKYVNEGKGDVSNVKAQLKEGSKEGSKVQYLGNFEPGKSGSINFLVTPENVGKNEYKAVITYEDANMNIQQKEVDISFEAQENIPMDAGMEMADAAFLNETGPTHGKMSILWGTAAAAISGVVLLIVVKKRAHSKKLSELNFDEESFDSSSDDTLNS